MKMNNRTNWVSALTALPAEELLSLTKELSVDWNVRPLSLPQSGLGMLKLNDTAFNEPFYLGEIPLASAWVEVTTVDGQQAEGAAQVMDDQIEVAESLAVCDAVLSAQLPGWERVSMLVEQGLMQREAIRVERKKILAHTQVNFSLLDAVEGNNANT